MAARVSSSAGAVNDLGSTLGLALHHARVHMPAAGDSVAGPPSKGNPSTAVGQLAAAGQPGEAWRIPARVAGTWTDMDPSDEDDYKPPGGGICFALELAVIMPLMLIAYGALAILGLGLIVLGLWYMGDDSMITTGFIMK